MRQEELLLDDGQLFTPEVKADIKSTQRSTRDMFIMLLAPTLISYYYYGLRAFLLQGTAVCTAVLCEYIFGKLLKAFPTLRDGSAAITGLILALCLPASSPLWFAALGASFAILVAKLPFGNARSLLFSPAAAGLAFLAVCFPKLLFTYPTVPQMHEPVEIYGSPTFRTGVSLAKMLSEKASIGNHFSNYLIVLLGDFAGPMGTTCVLALFGSLLFFAIRHFKAFEVTASFLVTVALFAFFFPRVVTGRFLSVFMELSAGMLFFASIFLLTNDVLLPKRFYGRLCYGCCAGLATMILRHFGAFEEGIVFVILLMNVLSVLFNKFPLSKWERKRLSLARQKRLAEIEKANSQKEHEQWFIENETEIAEAVPVPEESPAQESSSVQEQEPQPEIVLETIEEQMLKAEAEAQAEAQEASTDADAQANTDAVQEDAQDKEEEVPTFSPAILEEAIEIPAEEETAVEEAPILEDTTPSAEDLAETLVEEIKTDAILAEAEKEAVSSAEEKGDDTNDQ